MRRALSLIAKTFLIGVVTVLVIVLILIGALMLLRLPPTDKMLIKETLRPDLPGYSRIRVLEGSNRYATERGIALEVLLESYTGPVHCWGEIYYRHGDPSVHALRWYDWACIGHWIVVEHARGALEHDYGSFPYNFPFCSREVFTAFTLERWVVEGWIRIDQILWPEMREKVRQVMVMSWAPPPSPFDVSTARIYDLAPDLPEEEKVPTYIWRCDGTIDLIWRGGPRWWEQPVDRNPGDIELPLPVENSAD